MPLMYFSTSSFSKVVSSQPTAHPPMAVRLGSGPTATHCGHCSQQVVTKVTYTKGAFTWIMCIIIFVLGGVLGCFLIPCFIGSCQDVNHRCPRCGTSLGTFKRL
ncbi:unnamed protein product [Dicrocoelium dendriticum]|nr:unnamed protein product [Dicrocoelium dendriticum]